MIPIDKIVFGDNQFFGINHMSQEKAQQLSEKFYDINNIFDVYNIAYDLGINAIMLNSNSRAIDICEYFRNNKSKFKDINWYPSIPYPHKYANLVAEKGIFPAINDVILKDNSTFGIMGLIAKGGIAVLSKDVIKIMYMLIDIEMKIFKGLNIKVIFLQNIISDLLLGFGVKEIFFEYCEYNRKKYNTTPGFITQNLPYMIAKFKEWGIVDVVICSSINKIGYLMSPNTDSYINVIETNDPNDYQIMAMSTLASGAIQPKEAYQFINQQNIQSVVFGASSKSHIKETLELINLTKK